MTSFVGRKVLVTGGAGFIGSHLVERLAAEGARVTVLHRYSSTGSTGWLAGVPGCRDINFVAGDVCDASTVRAATAGCDTVFHLAALIGIPYSYESPEAYVRTNILGTLRVLEAARVQGAAVVVTSTSEVYGTAKYVPIDEAHPLQAQSPYAATKIAADALALSFQRSFDLDVRIARPFNTYGPRQSERAVIPAIIRQLLASNEVRLGELDSLRDLNYVHDTVEGFLAVASRGVSGKTYNLGSGHEVSVRELVAVIGSVMRLTPVIVQEEARRRPQNSEVMRLLASAELASQELQWSPKTSLTDGLRATVEWWRSRAGELGDRLPGAYRV